MVSADWVTEMREQIRLWFYSMLFMGVVLDGRAPYDRVLTYEKVNDETGRPMHKSWGNAIWFDDAIEEMGADVMRWMYAAQPPAQNLNFGYGPAATVKTRLLRLWNIYAFFVLYANIDDHAPDLAVLESGPATARELDRWLVAATQQLIGECTAALDAYDSPRLVGAFEAYVDDLSNWYVRLSRPRFWKSEDAEDKRAAYQSLWYALVQASRCVAPVMPFLADELWQNLVRGACPGAPASVHHAGYPTVDHTLADAALLEQMAAVRSVVTLGHSARNDAGIKLRQPLQAATVVTHDPRRRQAVASHLELVAGELGVKEVHLAESSDEFAEVEVMPILKVLGPKLGRDLSVIRGLLREGQFTLVDGGVDVGDWRLEPGEFELRTRARPGFSVVDGEGFAVVLDTEVTPELALEGTARDLIRTINQMRADAELELTDRIVVTYPDSDGQVTEAFRRHGDWIATETLAVTLEPGDQLRIAVR